jgi:2-oxoglutarate ferredoxin oxidoreductase subunit gamma
MSTISIILAGFGGQGILFAGKFLAYKGLVEDKKLSWLPSYGPEMRGGTANCSVILSDTDVGSPIIANPDCLMAMNLPSLDKFEASVVSGGKIFVDSTLVERKVNRDDVDVFYIPATAMAKELGYPTLANMIMVGKMMKECEEIGYSYLEETLNKIVSAKHRNLYDANFAAIEAGYNFK